MRRQVIFYYLIVLSLIGGCATLQIFQNTEQRLALAFATHTAATNTVADLAEKGKITSAEGHKLAALLDTSRAVLRDAKAALDAGALDKAEGQLTLASGVLAKVQDYLATKQPQSTGVGR